MVNTIQILPSLLSANLMTLETEIASVTKAGADMLHIDIMDNHYVPNLTFGPHLCKTIKEHFPDVVLDVHLMITPLDEMITTFVATGANRISIHPDATIHLNRSLQLIRDAHCKAGLVLNPTTSIDCIQWCRHQLDFVLIMTVNPGFAGQQLIPSVIPKIAQICKLYPDLSICVDGGITTDNITTLAQAGANEFVAGSTIFQNNHAEIIPHLRQLASQAYVHP